MIKHILAAIGGLLFGVILIIVVNILAKSLTDD